MLIGVESGFISFEVMTEDIRAAAFYGYDALQGVCTSPFKVALTLFFKRVIF